MKDIPFVFLQNFLTFAKPKPTPMYEGFFRVAAASPSVVVADTATNCCNIISLMKQADEAGADLVVFPEMCITGYTCADLFHSETLLQGASKGLEDIASASAKFPGLVAVVGLPVRRGARLYNCAAVVAQGAGSLNSRDLFCLDTRNPGAMALQRTPVPAKWVASHWVKLEIAAFAPE